MFRPTMEQQAVIGAVTAGANVVLEAGAGTGKTSTLRFVAEAMSRSTGLYLAYTRVTAAEAARAFPGSVSCVTAHALAYRAVGHHYARRLSAARMPSWAVAKELGIGTALPLGEDLLITPAHQARIVMSTVERFCRSDDPDMSAAHVPQVHGVDTASHGELTWRVVPLARRAWADIRRPDGRLPFRHDHYLKLWQLTGPVLAADYLMFDEAQDANPVIAAIVDGQPHAQKIIVGDSCQAIYGWRGATDSLSSWPCDVRLNLTASFRFGPPIAEEANKWLAALGAPYRLTGIETRDSAIGTVTDPQVILCRTNAEAFQQARAALQAGRRAALVGGAADLKMLAQAALDLQAAGRTDHAELAAFRSWGAVRGYARTDTAGADLATAVRLIDSCGPAVVLGAVDALSEQGRAEVIACTAHAAKGREWDRVRIAGDFPAPGDGRPMPRGEAMLGYVAVTRARSQLDRTGLTWIDRQPPVHARKETVMTTAGTPIPELAAGDRPRPYVGRAQAESGCRIIATDYTAWTTVSGTVPADDPAVVQLAQQWRTLAKHDLDDPGVAAARYRLLAHAAETLAAVGVPDDCGTTGTDALRRLAGHARLHAGRLAATAEQQFLRSDKAGPYTGRGHAEFGSRIVASDYGKWAAAQAGLADDHPLRDSVLRMREAWTAITTHGLDGSPADAAARYRELSETAKTVAERFSPDLRCHSLWVLLELASHAGKHAVRLQATAEAYTGTVSSDRDRRIEAMTGQFETATPAREEAPTMEYAEHASDCECADCAGHHPDCVCAECR